MRNCKLIVWAAIAIASLSSVALAQGPGPGGPGGPGGRGPGGPGGFAAMRARMAKMEEDMYTQIGATAGQKKKLAALRDERTAKFEAMMKTGKRPDRATMQAMRADYDTKVQKILSKSQYTKLEALRKAARAKFGGGMRRGPGGPGGPGGPPPGGPGH